METQLLYLLVEVFIRLMQPILLGKLLLYFRQVLIVIFFFICGRRRGKQNANLLSVYLLES